MKKIIVWIVAILVSSMLYMSVIEFNVLGLNVTVLMILRLIIFTSIIMGAFYKLNPSKLFVFPITVAVFNGLLFILGILSDIDMFMLMIWLFILMSWFVYTLLLALFLKRLHTYNRLNKYRDSSQK